MYNNTYRKVGALVEDMMKVLRYGFSVLVHEDMVIQAIQSPYAWNNHSIWGGRERETERERRRRRRRRISFGPIRIL
jgi:hypothetical protein